MQLIDSYESCQHGGIEQRPVFGRVSTIRTQAEELMQRAPQKFAIYPEG